MTGLALLTGYLLGSIPFAILIGGAEIRRVGSGNPGAANVWRVRRPALGVSVFALDVVKGCAAVWLALAAGADAFTTVAAGGCAIVGHMYPIWLRFAGGKGVATSFGVFLVLAPLAAVADLAVFAAAVWLTRYVSVGSMLAAVCLPGLLFVLDGEAHRVGLAAVVVPLVLFRHRSNLTRVLAGSEHRLGDRTGR